MVYLADDCNHKGRVPFKQVWYRPIFSLICSLLQYPNFIAAVSYKHINAHGKRYGDIMDGEVAQQSLKEMNKIFADICSEDELNGIDTRNYKPMNLLISMFYDGCQVLKSRYTNFSPLLIVILNLPPSYRTQLGIGQFVLSVVTAPSKSNAEDFIFKQCLVRELLDLHEGKKLRIGRTIYIIQVRCIIKILDTKAIEKDFDVQAARSFAGCPFCTFGRGMKHVDSFDSMHYNANRDLLEFTNRLRKIGQTQNCCPRGYNKMEDRNEEKSARMERFNPILEKIAYTPRELIIDNLITCEGDSEEAKSKLRTQPSTFHNSDVCNFDELKAGLYYHHCDMRPEKQFKVKTLHDYISDYVADKDRKQSLTGVKGLTPFVAISSFRFEHNGPGPFHVIKNFSEYLLELGTGARPKNPITSGLSKFCKMTNSHPSIANV